MIPADRLFNRLSSTHLNTISGIENPVKRAFYEMETIRGCWSVKELERQIASLYYERSGLSKNKEALSALVQQQATHKPVTGSKGKVYSMCGLCLQRVLYRADMFY